MSGPALFAADGQAWPVAGAAKAKGSCASGTVRRLQGGGGFCSPGDAQEGSGGRRVLRGWAPSQSRSSRTLGPEGATSFVGLAHHMACQGPGEPSVEVPAPKPAPEIAKPACAGSNAHGASLPPPLAHIPARDSWRRSPPGPVYTHVQVEATAPVVEARWARLCGAKGKC